MQAVAHFIDTFVPEHYDLFLDLNRGIRLSQGKLPLPVKLKLRKFPCTKRI